MRHESRVGLVVGSLLLVALGACSGDEATQTNTAQGSQKPAVARIASPAALQEPAPTVPVAQPLLEERAAAALVHQAAAKADAAGTVSFRSTSVVRGEAKVLSISVTEGVSSMALPTSGRYTVRSTNPRATMANTSVMITPPVLYVTTDLFKDNAALSTKPWLVSAIESRKEPVLGSYGKERTFLKQLGGGPRNAFPSIFIKGLSVADSIVERPSVALDGVTVRHFVVRLPIAGLATAYDGDLLGQYGYGNESAAEESGLPVDVWIDEAGLVRRIGEVADPTIPLTETMDVLEYGVPLDLRPPPADDTIDLRALIAAEAA